MNPITRTPQAAPIQVIQNALLNINSPTALAGWLQLYTVAQAPEQEFIQVLESIEQLLQTRHPASCDFLIQAANMLRQYNPQPIEEKIFPQICQMIGSRNFAELSSSGQKQNALTFFQWAAEQEDFINDEEESNRISFCTSLIAICNTHGMWPQEFRYALAPLLIDKSLEGTPSESQLYLFSTCHTILTIDSPMDIQLTALQLLQNVIGLQYSPIAEESIRALRESLEEILEEGVPELQENITQLLEQIGSDDESSEEESEGL